MTMRLRRMPMRLGLLLVVIAATLGLAAGVAAAANRVHLETKLSGLNENPDADPDGRGEADVVLRLDTNQVCFDIEFERTGTPFAGHIHVGGPLDNGDIVVTFFNVAGNPLDPLHDQLERERARGCVSASPEILAAIATSPSGYYVNLHNARFPTGAIRGQLSGD